MHLRNLSCDLQVGGVRPPNSDHIQVVNHFTLEDTPTNPIALTQTSRGEYGQSLMIQPLLLESGRDQVGSFIET